MFGKLFKGQKSETSLENKNPQVEVPHPQMDPNVKADEAVLNLLVQEYKARYPDDKGVHVETLLSLLGALAGFGCQMGIRETLIKTGKAQEKDLFVIVETKDGQKFYYGDFLNEPIFSTKQGRISVWSLVGGAAQSVGAKNLPDINVIAKYYAENIGDQKFFIPQLPQNHMPRILPAESLGYWSSTRNLQILYRVAPIHWGWTYAIAAQKLIIQSKDILDPALGAKIVMEAAVPMSKLNPERVENAYFSK
ncbi:MAG: hypothetical protein HYS17_01760 [Micavibrio aeruginosavorus]|uniref:Uncharacterized protein n=1 Tax=Micavibrio aeruginosavorus TaxID=349221 RepID=A0A7T5R2X5_9BACT|nr:MAG: hypothetical protein HYS17_01760 [Micavibrio aeruginosavorus]